MSDNNSTLQLASSVAAAAGAAFLLGRFLEKSKGSDDSHHVQFTEPAEVGPSAVPRARPARSARKSVAYLAAPAKPNQVDTELDTLWATPQNEDGSDPTDCRMEHDLLGDLAVPNDRYYGIQTLRAVSNYQITGIPLSHFPDFIIAYAMVKKAAAAANARVGSLPEHMLGPITAACDELISGVGGGPKKLHKEFVVDMVQGGAGTSTNMNCNEVVANRALELMGHKKGQYEHLHPNDHVNKSQSTNDSYPTSCKLAILLKQGPLVKEMEALVAELRRKAAEFKNVLKMGRTQLQDAVPMTLGQEFNSWANMLEKDIAVVKFHAKGLLSVNMGGTAIGTGICANPDFSDECVAELSKVTGFDFSLADDLIEASSSVDAMAAFSGTLRRVSIKLSKVCSDLRILSSGPRCGFSEVNLPPMAPGSSIMPGKVNPIIPEVVNQVAFAVCGNDLTSMMAAEHGQLQLNVFEPVLVFRIFQSLDMLTRGMRTLRKRCIEGITANEDNCKRMVTNSIAIVTALLPEIGYKNCSTSAKIALRDNKSVGDVVLENGFLSKERLEEVLQPANMVGKGYVSEVEVEIEVTDKKTGRKARKSVMKAVDLTGGGGYGDDEE